VHRRAFVTGFGRRFDSCSGRRLLIFNSLIRCVSPYVVLKKGCYNKSAALRDENRFKFFTQMLAADPCLLSRYGDF